MYKDKKETLTKRLQIKQRMTGEWKGLKNVHVIMLLM